MKEAIPKEVKKKKSQQLRLESTSADLVRLITLIFHLTPNKESNHNRGKTRK